MKEFAIENGHEVKLVSLRRPRLPEDQYAIIHKRMIIPCHDVFIQYQGGILIVVRENQPAKGLLWPIGGAIERGIPIEDSLRKKVMDECGLGLTDIIELGHARTYFKTDPFNTGKGTDTINFVFSGKGIGNLRLDKLHSNPAIVTAELYKSKYRQKLHPYVTYFMDTMLIT